MAGLAVFSGNVREDGYFEISLNLFGLLEGWIQLFLRKDDSGAGEARKQPAQKQNQPRGIRGPESNRRWLRDGDVQYPVFVKSIGNMRLFALVQVEQIIVFCYFRVPHQRCLLQLFLISIHQRFAICLINASQ